MKRIVTTLLSAAALVALFAECKPSPGDACTENAKSCTSPTSRLACIDNKYVAQTCKGPSGCKEEKGTTSCDATRGDIGDPCASENAAVCSTDGKEKLRCEHGKLAFVARCAKGPCQVSDSGEGACTWPYANVGDPCTPRPGAPPRASGSCTEDFKSELTCKDGKLVLARACRGEAGCAPLTSGPWCDRSIAIPGDDCDPKMEEFSVACDKSMQNMLTCVGGKLTHTVRCGGENKCYVRTYGKDGFSHYQAACDQSLAKIGDDCVKDGSPACSDDLKDKLMCQNGKFVVDTACKKGCLVHAPDGTAFICKENAAKSISGH
jgi:hypothetical protein